MKQCSLICHSSSIHFRKLDICLWCAQYILDNGTDFFLWFHCVPLEPWVWVLNASKHFPNAQAGQQSGSVCFCKPSNVHAQYLNTFWRSQHSCLAACLMFWMLMPVKLWMNDFSALLITRFSRVVLLNNRSKGISERMWFQGTVKSCKHGTVYTDRKRNLPLS